jgi:hypothetical protein
MLRNGDTVFLSVVIERDSKVDARVAEETADSVCTLLGESEL